ncbi:MAG: hypothetical protein H0W72_02250 [Planctomycetes bacterium]|nr:hypothetical protein [Planctomycetota bacterium]
MLRYHRRNARLTWTVGISALVALGLGGALVAEKAKERTRWQVVYREDFTRATTESLAATWAVTFLPWATSQLMPAPVGHGRFAVRDGALHILGDNGYTDLAYRGDLLGGVRVEWDYLARKENLNFNCFIGGANRWGTGYTFHVGSWSNPSFVCLTQGKEYEVLDCTYLAQPMQAGRRYRFVLEKEEQRLRLQIDGQVVLEDELPSDAYGETANTFGFDCTGLNEMVIDNVVVAHKPMAQRVSPLAVADRLTQVGQHEQARAQYRDIVRTFPDGDLAVLAAFRGAVCAGRLGDDAICASELEAWLATHGEHQAAPYALHELTEVTRRQGDAARVRALRERLASWRGHPVLAAVLRGIASEHLSEVAPGRAKRVGDRDYPADTVATVKATIAALQGWAERYGLEWWKNDYAERASFVLLNFAEYDYIIDRFVPYSNNHGEALMQMGRFAEVLAAFPPGSYVRGSALMATARYDELFTGSYPLWLEWQARADVGQVAELLDGERIPEMRRASLLLAGRFDDVLAEFPDDRHGRAEALLGLGRSAEVEGVSDDPTMLARALLAGGRLDELETSHPSAYAELYRCALARWIAGERPRARALVAAIDGGDVPCGIDETMFARRMLGGFLDLQADPAIDPATAFATVLARPRGEYKQRIWHLVRYVVGELDDTAFLAQPYRHLVDERLVFAQALRADCRGQAAAALALYLTYVDAPGTPSSSARFERDFLAWRIAVLSP